MKSFLVCITAAIFFIGCTNDKSKNKTNQENIVPEQINYKIVTRYPHDTLAFTEGFFIHNGQLYESTGGKPRVNNFRSWFGPVDLKTGKFTRKIMLDTSYFGEGINIIGNNLYQLTWEDQKGFIYDATTLEKIKEFKYNGEGWALTNDGKNLIMSNGGSHLQFIDPSSLKVVKEINIMDNNGPVSNINELELINGYVYANQYLTNYILKIDLANDSVVGKLDCSKLAEEAKQKYRGSQEMNGIAFDSSTKKIYVTGKAWPYIYEITF